MLFSINLTDSFAANISLCILTLEPLSLNDQTYSYEDLQVIAASVCCKTMTLASMVSICNIFSDIKLCIQNYS